MTVIAGTDLEVNIEAYHSTPVGREYGALTYGDQMYGAGTGQGPPTWQPITCESISCDMLRGTQDASRIVPVEQMMIEVSDPEFAVFEYGHEGSPIITSLEISDLVRVTVAGQTLATGRIESVREIQNPGEIRRLVIEAYGIATDFGFTMQRGDRPSETAIKRANDLIDQIPYLPKIETSQAAKTCWPAADTEINLIQELDQLAATTAAVFRTDREGTPRFEQYPAQYRRGVTVSDACDNGSELTPVAIEWAADQLQLLNMVNVDIDTGGDILPIDVQSDDLSVNLYGPHDSARGFPALVFNQTVSDALRWAGAVKSHASRAIHRPARLEFDTMTGAAWADYLTVLDLDAGILVKRTQNTSVHTEWRCIVAGYRLVINTAAQTNKVRVAGEIYLETIERSAA
jgi:hypothetical protein